MTGGEHPQDTGFEAYLQGFGVGLAVASLFGTIQGPRILGFVAVVGMVCILTSFLLGKRAERGASA